MNWGDFGTPWVDCGLRVCAGDCGLLGGHVHPASGHPVLRWSQDAWATAAEQRQLWRDVGIALLEGGVMYLTHQAFGAWCATEKFDMDRRYRSVSM